MDKKQIMDLMEIYGFTFNMETRNGQGKATALYFMSEPEYQGHKKDRMTVPPYNCTIYPGTNEFEFTYEVPGSINRLVTPKCSPFANEEHFNRMGTKFGQMVRTLWLEYGQ